MRRARKITHLVQNCVLSPRAGRLNYFSLFSSVKDITFTVRKIITLLQGITSISDLSPPADCKLCKVKHYSSINATKANEIDGNSALPVSIAPSRC